MVIPSKPSLAALGRDVFEACSNHVAIFFDKLKLLDFRLQVLFYVAHSLVYPELSGNDDSFHKELCIGRGLGYGGRVSHLLIPPENSRRR
jgi:hypothetical protein